MFPVRSITTMASGNDSKSRLAIFAKRTWVRSRVPERRRLIIPLLACFFFGGFMFGFLPVLRANKKARWGGNPVELHGRQNKVGAARPSRGLSQPDIIGKCVDYFTHVDNRQGDAFEGRLCGQSFYRSLCCFRPSI